MKKISWAKPLLVVSKDSASNVIISRFKDDLWDLTIYKQKQYGSSKIDFTKWPEKTEADKDLRYRLKVILYLLLNESTGGRQSILTVTTVCTTYQTFLNKLVKYCISHKKSLADVLEAPTEILRFSKTLNTSCLATFASFLRVLLEYGPEKSGFTIMNGIHIQQLRVASRKRAKADQTAFIPERLLASFMLHWKEEVDLFNGNWKNVILFLNTHFSSPGSGLTHNHQAFLYSKNISSYEPDFKSLARRCKLTVYFKRYDINSVKKLSAHLVFMQSICKCFVHLYSGMRSDEVMSLKVDALKHVKNSNGIVKWTLSGETTKYSGRRKNVQWITCEDIRPAWRALLLIAKYIAKHEGVNYPWPIFISVGYLGLSTAKTKCQYGVAKTYLIHIDPIKYVGDEAIISKEDIDTLRAVDPHRDWESKKYRVGQRWPLKSHQFRRTIALLAAQSGLVSIQTLKRQLQHITQEMSFYYCSGSAGLPATDTYSDELVEVFRSTSVEATAYAYVADFILSTESVMATPKLSKLGLDKRDGKSNIPEGEMLLESREDLLRKVDSGELSYKPTILGACLKNGPCVDMAHRSLTACLECPTAFIHMSKLDRLIVSQERVVQSLDSDSVDFVHESRLLGELVDYRKRGSKNGK